MGQGYFPQPLVFFLTKWLFLANGMALYEMGTKALNEIARFGLLLPL